MSFQPHNSTCPQCKYPPSNHHLPHSCLLMSGTWQIRHSPKRSAVVRGHSVLILDLAIYTLRYREWCTSDRKEDIRVLTPGPSGGHPRRCLINSHNFTPNCLTDYGSIRVCLISSHICSTDLYRARLVWFDWPLCRLYSRSSSREDQGQSKGIACAFEQPYCKKYQASWVIEFLFFISRHALFNHYPPISPKEWVSIYASLNEGNASVRRLEFE